MEKKKLLFVNNNMEIGGIQKALVNLLREIHVEYDITLFLFHKHGELLKDIPSSVKIIEAGPVLSVLGTSYVQSKKMGVLFLWRTALSVYSKLIGSKWPIRMLVASAHKIGKFDAAISYMQNSDGKILYGGCNEFVLKKVQADQKITYLHCDFEHYEGNNAYNRSLYSKFDQIVSVSNSCVDSFVKMMPSLEQKVKCVHNCYDFAQIRDLAEQDPVIYDHVYINMVTVARLSPEKGILRCLPIMKCFHVSGLYVKWHIIGEGSLVGTIRQFIVDEDMEDEIVLYGSQSNPYRFMKEADFLFVPSYHEAAPMVFLEAASLNLPIFTTDTCSAKEMILEKNNGWICENSEEGIYRELEWLLIHKEKILEKKHAMEKSFDNQKSLIEFRLLVE